MDMVDIQSSIKCDMHGGREGNDSDPRCSILVWSNELQRALQRHNDDASERVTISIHPSRRLQIILALFLIY